MKSFLNNVASIIKDFFDVVDRDIYLSKCVEAGMLRERVRMLENKLRRLSAE